MKRNSSFHRCNSLQQPPAHFTADRAAGISRGIPLPKLHVGPQKESQNRTEDCFPPQIQSSCARSCSCTLSPGDKLGEKACRVHVSGERRCSPAERCCPENAQHPSGGCDASFLAATTGSPSDCPADGNSPAHPAQHHTALHTAHSPTNPHTAPLLLYAPHLLQFRLPRFAHPNGLPAIRLAQIASCHG